MGAVLAPMMGERGGGGGAPAIAAQVRRKGFYTHVQRVSLPHAVFASAEVIVAQVGVQDRDAMFPPACSQRSAVAWAIIDR